MLDLRWGKWDLAFFGFAVEISRKLGFSVATNVSRKYLFGSAAITFKYDNCFWGYVLKDAWRKCKVKGMQAST